MTKEAISTEDLAQAIISGSWTPGVDDTELYRRIRELESKSDIVTRDHMNQKISEAISAARKRWAKSDQVLDGYVLVPVEPSESMLHQGSWVNGPGGNFHKKAQLRSEYKAMINEAQEER